MEPDRVTDRKRPVTLIFWWLNHHACVRGQLVINLTAQLVANRSFMRCKKLDKWQISPDAMLLSSVDSERVIRTLGIIFANEMDKYHYVATLGFGVRLVVILHFKRYG